ncbi:MAG: LacI family DNA-binding transcriptional regulator [Sediminibacterium sp.]|nr:LacI family DNA-binding transcriptional regulator [Sediminibacterium sp.]
MKRLQLEDLAKQLGYSKTLISMVLNGKGDQYGISKKTQTLVLEEVAKLDYTPNKFAKALRTGKSYFIGMIVADISNPFYSAIAKNIESTLFERGYNLMVCSTEENDEKEKRLIDMMINQQGVDGIIVASTARDGLFLESPRFNRTPFVLIDRILPSYKGHYVVSDNYGGSCDIVSKLVEQGCKKIACLSITPRHLSTIEERIRGYKDSLDRKKIPFLKELMVDIHFNSIEEETKNALRNLLKTHSDLDAIYTINNPIATAVLKAFREDEFKKAASKIKLACFDDIDLFNLIDIPVLSVSQPVHDLGKRAAELLMDVIDQKVTEQAVITLPTYMISRK